MKNPIKHKMGPGRVDASKCFLFGTGAYVIVINSEKVTVGGRKAEQKKYYRHSGTPGGLKTEAFQDLQKVSCKYAHSSACT